MLRMTMLAAAGWLAAALPATADAKPGDKDKDKPAKAETIAQQIAADIREAQALLPKANLKSNRDKLELVLTRLELHSTELQKELAAMTKLPKPTAVTADQLALIVKGLKVEGRDAGRLSFVEDLGKSRHYTSAQVKSIVKEFSTDDARVQAAVILYPQVIDAENFLLVYETFTTNTGRAALREKLKGK